MKIGSTFRALLTAGLAAASPTVALADLGHDKAPTFGRAGEAHHVTRTIEMRMGEMYFDPSRIAVKPGETIRFIVINEGDAVHEFNIGTPDNWDAHMNEMARMTEEGIIDYDRISHARMREMGMMHTDPNAVLLEPGERAEIIWEFPESPTAMGFACNVPGHRESGMVGAFDFGADS